jgi:hypothetical protein
MENPSTKPKGRNPSRRPRSRWKQDVRRSDTERSKLRRCTGK